MWKKKRFVEAEDRRVEYCISELERIEPTTWTADLLNSCRQRVIKLNLMGEEPSWTRWVWMNCVPGEGFWRCYPLLNQPHPGTGRRNWFLLLPMTLRQSGGAACDWDSAAWRHRPDSTPDLNCGRTHVTNLMPGLPSFPCDLRWNPQKNSTLNTLITVTLQERRLILAYGTGEFPLMFPPIHQDLPVKSMG